MGRHRRGLPALGALSGKAGTPVAGRSNRRADGGYPHAGLCRWCAGMSGLLEERPLQWAEPLRPDRIVATAMLGLRPLRYVSEGVAAVGPAIEGLRVVAVGAAEIPVFHQSTGLYGFLHLPPGDRRIEISDPLQQLLAWAITAAVPDRSAIRTALERGVSPP